MTGSDERTLGALRSELEGWEHRGRGRHLPRVPKVSTTPEMSDDFDAPARPLGRLPRYLAGAAGVVLATAGVLLLFGGLPPAPTSETPPAATIAPPAPRDASPPPDPGPLQGSGRAPGERLWPPPSPDTACPATGTPSADTDGDGCPDQLEIMDGSIRAGSRRWAVGRPDDVIAVGDWNCDGAATPAVLRAATGRLFVFDGWPRPGEQLVGRQVRVTPGAVTLDARGCGHAAVRLSDGSVFVVSTAPTS